MWLVDQRIVLVNMCSATMATNLVSKNKCNLSHTGQNYWVLIGWDRGHFWQSRGHDYLIPIGVKLLSNEVIAKICCWSKFSKFSKLPLSLLDSGNFVKTLKIRVKLILNCPQAHAITYTNRWIRKRDVEIVP